MADWYVSLNTEGNFVGEFSVMNCEAEVRNSEVGGFSGELALGQTRRLNPTVGIARDSIAPYRTRFQLWRQSSGSGVCITDGMITSINLSFNRDTVMISGKDWKHYLQRRIYPFDPEAYVTYNAQKEFDFWDQWPKQWPFDPVNDDPPDITTIVRDIMLSMRTGIPVDAQTSPRPTATALGVPDITWNLSDTGITIPSYKIYPGDQTSIYDHITKLSEMKDGFEWDILPVSKEFKMWSPTKFGTGNPVYTFAVTLDGAMGEIVEFDWTNEGPDGTYLIGLGSGRHKVGRIWTTVDNLTAFDRYDLVYDYGEIQSGDVILQKLKDQNDLWPQKKLQLSLLNPEFLPQNFYTADRPRSLIANVVRAQHDFAPLHQVSAYFQINAIKWSVDASSNETVSLELMQIYEPVTGYSGGIPQGA